MQDQLTPIRVSFRTQLKKLRGKSGWTHDQAARRLKIKPRTYSAYEQGRCMPPNPLLIKMASLWHISIEELVKGKKALVANAKKVS